MTWVRFDDGMPLHPKVLGLSDGAYRLWTNGLAFANRAVTDGRIPAPIVPTLDHRRAWTRRQIDTFAREVVTAGLWLETVDGFEIHGYAEYQEEALKTSVEARKAGARERKRKQREREKQARSGPGHGVTPRDIERDITRDMGRDVRVTPGVTERVTGGVTSPVTAAVTALEAPLSFFPEVSHPPVPSRPVPSRNLSPDGERETCESAPPAPVASPAPRAKKPRSPEAKRAALEAAEAEADALADGLPPPLLAQVRQGLAEASGSGKLSVVAWRNALRDVRAAAERHGERAAQAVADSLEVYADRYAGQRGAAYLVGIVRGWDGATAATGPARGRSGGRRGPAPALPHAAFGGGNTPEEVWGAEAAAAADEYEREYRKKAAEDAEKRAAWAAL